MQEKKPFLASILFVYHILFSVAYHFYVSTYGGDSLSYWELSIKEYRPAETWMEYFEYGNFFMQWLNYFPYKVLGIPYFVGNLFYGILGGLGFVMLLGMCLKYWGWNREKPIYNAWILLLFLPNLHFWTGGVGKETLLWVGMMCCFWALHAFQKYWYLLLLGIFLSLMVRPINGLMLLFLTFLWFALEAGNLKIKTRLVLLICLAVVGIVAFKMLLRQTHIPFPTIENISAFFDSQQQFLQDFGAGSYVSMDSISFPERIFSILFRPMVWEADGFWQWVAALENSFLLLWIILGIYLWARKPFWPGFPFFLFAGLVLGLVFTVIYAFTLNNFGIFMRMKSIFVPFFYLGAWQVIKEKLFYKRVI